VTAPKKTPSCSDHEGAPPGLSRRGITRAQRAARLRAIEGVPDQECVVEMGYEPTDCDCEICDHHQPKETPDD